MRNRITRVQLDEMSSNSLHDYHKSANKCTINGDLTLKHRPTGILAHFNRKRGRRAHKKSRLNPTVSPLQTDHNIFQGVHLMPMFGIGIQGDSTCDHWYPDHMALAISKADGTLSIGHCVLSKSCSDSAHNFMIKNKIACRKVSGKSHRL